MNDFYERLHGAISNSYDAEELSQMVQFRMNQRLDQIVAAGNLFAVVASLIAWAPKPGLNDLPIHAAEFKVARNARVPSLDSIRAEFEKEKGLGFPNYQAPPVPPPGDSEVRNA